MSGRFDEPVFRDAVATLERAVTVSGVPLGGAALTPEQTTALVGAGYRVLFHGFDVLMLKERIAHFRTWTSG